MDVARMGSWIDVGTDPQSHLEPLALVIRKGSETIGVGKVLVAHLFVRLIASSAYNNSLRGVHTQVRAILLLP